LRLIFIYGPPAVGKLTIARELSKYTGFKLFHNHISIQEVGSIFDFGTPIFWQLVGNFRKEMIKAAVEEDINTIFTMVYAKGPDDKYVENIRNLVESKRGRVCFVRLHCNKEELLRRVKTRSRREWGKLNSRNELEDLLRKYYLFGKVTGGRSLSIDTSILTPREAALKIASHYELPKKK